MKEIKLTQGKVALVDDEDFEAMNKFKWQACKRGGTFYAEKRIRIGPRRDDRGIHLKLHRLIMGVSDPNVLVDHKDRNGLNNCRDNLRICTRSQNNRNRQAAKNSSSKYLGVSYHKHTKRWQASMTHNKKIVYIGLYGSEQEAAIAYNEKAKILNGEFANLNILQDGNSR